LKGILTDCSDSSELILGFIHLEQNDSIIEATYTNNNGEFNFKGLKRGTYQLVTNYYYYPISTTEIKILSNKDINICISANNPDSLISNLRMQPIYKVYYYGMPKYSDSDLNLIGKNYGVKWQNLGCVADDKYNEMINKILSHRNGENWEDMFWSEIKRTYN
jgi:hypothetical protein